MNTNAQLKYTSLDYVDDLVKAGFSDQQSKAQAKALFRVIEQNAVTKQDLKELESKIAYDMKELEVKLSADMKEMDVRLTTQIKELEVKLSHDIQEVKRDLKELDVRLTTQMKELDARLTTQIKELELKIAHEMKELGSSLFIKLSGVMAGMLTLSISITGLLIHFLR